jgi:Abnormal spindle-like microcephaly-assoc'd, ASPM-SPD-2-Hydin
VAFGLLLCGLAFAAVRPGVSKAAQDPIGAHSMLQLNDPYSFMQTMFAEAAGLHASAIRLDVAPALVFTQPSLAPDFSGLDEVMALSQQYHLRVIADLFTIPWWIADCETAGDLLDPERCGTNDLAAYGSMISQIVAHADPVIRDWEIWNEPNNGYFFTGTPQQYALMLRTAHDAVKAVDPQANVLLGGISNLSGMSWLTQVFATPGADAAQAFDIANIHERGELVALAPDITAFRGFLADYGFTGPLWVTEHGYPSARAFQYDPSYVSGPASQAAYLAASIPTLIDAGVSEVFVTERDNLTGQFASEGLLGGNVFDPPVANPRVVQKPAYATVAAISSCYLSLGRDCPGPGPAASPASLTIPATRLGTATVSTVSVSDPGPAPLQLGSLTFIGTQPSSVTVARDSCSNLILEPDQPCSVALRFTPLLGGSVTTTLELPSDSGGLSVAVAAVAPSVSSLTSPQLGHPVFAPVGGADGVGHTQRLVLKLTNPLSTRVHVKQSTLSEPDPGQFSFGSNHCAGAVLAPGATCALSVLFSPTQAGPAQTLLSLRGDGSPLRIMLRATGFALPAVTLVASTDQSPCFARNSHNRVLVATDEPASVSWRLVRRGQLHARRCQGAIGIALSSGVGRSSARGRTSTGAHRTTLARGGEKYVARFALPAGAGRRRLRPGAYRLTITAANAHGTSRARTMWLTVLP